MICFFCLYLHMSGQLLNTLTFTAHMGMNRGNQHFLKAYGVASKLYTLHCLYYWHSTMKCASRSGPTFTTNQMYSNAIQLEL